MTISVAGRPIHKTGDISELCRLAIAFIDGGTEWLRWAVGEHGVGYAFADESALAAGIQQGLQVSPYALAPRLGLMVSPVKLMTLSLADLRVLARAESGDLGPKTDSHVGPILHRHGMLTQADFDSGAAYLTGLDVGDKPVFQFMGFEDRAAVYDLAHQAARAEDQDPGLEKAAATFALAQGRTPLEFVDYFNVYLAIAAKAGRSASIAKREANAQAALDALLPLLFPTLDCPQVNGLVAPEEVAEAIGVWLMWGRSVGFARLSSGVRQIVQNTRYKPELGQDAGEFVDGYVKAAQVLLASTPLKRGKMAQDGATCAFDLETADEEAQLQLSAAGVISLNWLRRKHKPPTTPAKARTDTALEKAE